MHDAAMHDAAMHDAAIHSPVDRSRSRPRSVAAIAAALAMLAVLGSTAAAESFGWTAPAGCPTADDVERRIARRLDPDVAIGAIEVSVTRDGGRFVAAIDETRTLTSPSCDQLADAVALIVARLAHEARRAEQAEGDAAATTFVTVFAMPADAPRRPAPVLATRTVARPAKPTVATWGGGLRLLAISGIGIVPRVGVGGEIAAFVRREDAFGEIGYARWRASSLELSPGAPGGVEVGIHMLGLRGGWASRRMPLRGWLGVELGEMTGEGIALYQPRIGSARWTAIASGLGVAWPMARHVRLVGTFEVAAPVERARFTLVDGTEIYRPASASARCAVGLEIGWR